MRITANDRGTSTGRVRKNTANGNQSVSITASTTGEFEDLTNSDAVVAGDKLCYSITTGAGGTTFVPTIMSILFSATTNTVERFVGQAVSSTTNRMAFAGVGGGTTTESRAQLKVKTAGTFKNMLVNYSANTRDSTTTVAFRKNSANGNMSISVLAGVTGEVEDTSNTDTVVIDDLCCMRTDLAAGTGALTQQGTAVDFETTNNKWHFMVANAVTGISPGPSITTFIPIGGDLLLNTTGTESDMATDANVNFTASNLECNISVNTIVGDSTLKLRIDGADGTQAVSITSLSTGFFEDTTHSDIISASSQINYSLVTAGAGTSLTLRTIAMLGTIVTATSGSLFYGASQIKLLYLGSTQLKKAYLGSTLVYSD